MPSARSAINERTNDKRYKEKVTENKKKNITEADYIACDVTI
jgi:hypothetical protein